MQRSQLKPVQEEGRTQETGPGVRAGCQETHRDPQQSTIFTIQRETLKERKSKLENVIFKQSQELTEFQERKARAEKSLGLMQGNWKKKKVEVAENNPHLAQLEYDLEYDKNKILIQSLK